MTLPWNELEQNGDWDPPAKAKRLDAVLKKLPEMPGELRELYAHANGGSIGKVDFFDVDELENVNLKQTYRKAFPGAVFFASDGGDKFFFVDTSGALERGPGAVILMSRGAARAQNCILAAHDLARFYGYVIAGDRPWQGRLTLGASEIDDMLDLVAASADKYQGKPYDVMSDALENAITRVKVQIPSALYQLLREVDGMRIPAAGVTVRPAEHLEAVAGVSDGTYPGLLWFAEDDAGNRYGIAPGGWRGLEPDTVVKVAPGAAVLSAPAIGRLPQVITGWLRS